MPTKSEIEYIGRWFKKKKKRTYDYSDPRINRMIKKYVKVKRR